MAFTMCNFIYAKGSLKEQCHTICGFNYVKFCMCKRKLKGQCHEIFDFSCFSFLQAPEYPIRAISKFFFYSRNIRSSRCTTGVAGTGGKFTTSVIDTRGKLPLVSLTPATNVTPVANLLPVSLTLMANLQRWAQMFL